MKSDFYDRYIKPAIDRILHDINEELQQYFLEQEILDDFNLGCFGDKKR